MKKRIGFFAALVLMVSLTFVGCGGGPAKNVTKGDVHYSYTAGAYTVTGAKSTATDITIKREISGTPVSGIEKSAFENNTRIQSITFEEGTYKINFSISNLAFNGSQIKSITNLPQKTVIYYNALSMMENLETISMQENSNETFVRDGLLYRVVSGTTYLAKVPTNLTVLPDGWAEGVNAIDTGAMDYTAVSSLDIPATIDLVNSSAIMNPTNLKSITLHSRDTDIRSSSISTDIFNKNFRIYVDAKTDVSLSSYFSYGTLVSSYAFITHPLSCSGESHTCNVIHGGESGSGITATMAGYSYYLNQETEMVHVTVGQMTIIRSAPYMFIE